MGMSRLKKLIIFIIVVVLLVITCTVLYSYLHTDKPITNKIDDTKDIYYMVEGNEYSLFNGDSSDVREVDFENKFLGPIEFSYPVININTQNILGLNTEIKAKVLGEENNITQETAKGCIYVNKDNRYFRHEVVNAFQYQISIKNDIFSLVERSDEQRGCEGVVVKYQTYNIKNDGTFLNNHEVLNLYKYDENTLLTKLREYLNLDDNSLTIEKLYISLQEESIDIYIETGDGYTLLNYNGSDFSSKSINEIIEEAEE